MTESPQDQWKKQFIEDLKQGNQKIDETPSITPKIYMRRGLEVTKGKDSVSWLDMVTPVGYTTPRPGVKVDRFNTCS